MPTSACQADSPESSSLTGTFSARRGLPQSLLRLHITYAGVQSAPTVRPFEGLRARLFGHLSGWLKLTLPELAPPGTTVACPARVRASRHGSCSPDEEYQAATGSQQVIRLCDCWDKYHLSCLYLRRSLCDCLYRSLYVRNLPFNISSEEMYDIFGKYGAIRQIRL